MTADAGTAWPYDADVGTEHPACCMCRSCYWQRRAESAEAQRDALLKRLGRQTTADSATRGEGK